jgi:tRNA(Ile)-lysidine synthase
VPGTTRLAGCAIETRLIPEPVLPPEGIRAWCTPTKQYFDADKLTGSLVVRTRTPGDRMIPLGMEHARKLQDIMVDLRVPAFQRNNVPLVLMNGEILWVAGHTRSCHAPVDKTTTTLLEMELLLLL